MSLIFVFLLLIYHLLCAPWLDTFRKRDVLEVENISPEPLNQVSIDVTFSRSLLNSTNCYDIAFTDTNSGVLPFNIENCGNTESNAWVLIPNIPAGSSFILYMYYYDTSLTEIKYEADIPIFAFFFNGDTCPPNSVVWKGLDNYFPMGSKKVEHNYIPYDQSNHSHVFSPYENMTSNHVFPIENFCSFDGNTGKYIPSWTHKHDVSFESGVLNYDSSLPLYETFLLCRQNRSQNSLKKVSDRFKFLENMIMLFVSNETHEGWVKQEIVNDDFGRFLVPSSNRTGILGGSTSHSHVLPKIIENYPYDLEDKGEIWYPSYSYPDRYYWLPPDHKHLPKSQTCNTQSSTNNPPFLSVNVKRSVLEEPKIPPNTITLLFCNDTSSPCDIPLGWKLAENLLDKFPRGCDNSSPQKCVVGASGGSYSHTHSFKCYIDQNDDSYFNANNPALKKAYYGGGANFQNALCLGKDHQHEINGTVLNSTSLPRYHKLVFIQRLNSSVYSRIKKKRTDLMLCDGVNYSDVQKVCSGHGDCTKFDNCTCTDPRYFGTHCNDTFCWGVKSIREETCSGHGICDFWDHCICQDLYFGDHCNISTCFGIFLNDSSKENEICSGHGKCVDFDSCVCTENYFEKRCNESICFGYFFNDSKSCGTHGTCVGLNKCDCWAEEYYYGPNCNTTYCYNVPSNISGVCLGHGRCVSYDDCECTKKEYNYTEKCGWKCGKYLYSSRYTCSAHGECYDSGNCSCISDSYSGQLCNRFKCFGIENAIVESVCSGHGSCIDVDNCVCLVGYSTTNKTTPCDTWFCGKFEMRVHEVCTGMGICSSHQTCDCLGGYEGDDCETWSCGNNKYTDSNTCSGNGECVGPDDCICNTGFSGDLCETNDLIAAVMAPVLSVVTVTGILGVLVIGFLMICCACSIFVFLVVLFAVIFLAAVCSLCVLILCLGCVTCGYRLRVKKFSRLKNFDILMKEQEMEEDTSIAHIKINRVLFEIPYGEIKIERILGEGGSQSTVYKAKWKNVVVAFKCFKTRSFSTQNSFDEFEREVEIMSSVNHPNIVQFLGASLNPPRVGILMEFCENGEIVHYFKKHRITNSLGYPLLEKLRMMMEICSAFEYIHSRSIIHRDLKSENVLLSSKESCKLMDFGLSKIIERMSVQKTTRIGTAVYMAPEIINDATYDEKCDVFSFAILVYIMITENEDPYKQEGVGGIEMKVCMSPNFRPEMGKFSECLSLSFEEDKLVDVYNEEVRKGVEEWLSEMVTRNWMHDAKERNSFPELCEKLMGKMDFLMRLKDGVKPKLTLNDIFGKKEDDVEDPPKVEVFVDDEEEKEEEDENVRLRKENEELKMEVEMLKKKMEKFLGDESGEKIFSRE